MLGACALSLLALLQPGPAAAQSSADAPAAVSAPAAPVAPSAIKDSAEASDYVAAMAVADPLEQAAAFEAYVAKYPASAVKAQALEKAMAAYLVARDLDKVAATSVQVLALEPDNARAMAMAVFVLRARASAAPTDQAAALAARAADEAERGLAAMVRWRPRLGVSDADASAIHGEMLAIFNGALGYRALIAKDYAAAKPYYLAAVKADPTGLDNVYQLAVCLLQARPADPSGFWWAARAYDLAGSLSDAKAQAIIETYAKTLYAHYHGGDEGWDALLSQAQTGLGPPADFAVTPAPSAASVAVQAIHDAPVASLSFSDWEFILAQRDASPANQAAADKVWAHIAGLQARGVQMRFQIKVLRVGPDGLDGAITDDNQQTGHADLHVKLAAPPPAAARAGAVVSVTGLLTGYAPTPFAFTMEQAQVAGL